MVDLWYGKDMGQLVEQEWRGNTHAVRRVDRRTGRYQAYVPHQIKDWQPSIPADVVGYLAESERHLLETAAVTLHDTDPGGLLFWSESLGSSHIEGVKPSARKVVHALSRSSHWPERSFHEPVFEVVGNIQATESAIAMLADGRSLTVDSLCQAHRLLMDTTPTPHLGGVVRSEQNWIGGTSWHPLEADFVPPPPESCHELLLDLLAYVDRDDHSPLLQAALAHAQFEVIHPFGDGNGRTGRTLLYAILKRACPFDTMVPPVSLALSRSRDRYIEALVEFQQYVGPPDDPRRSVALMPWLEEFASATRDTCSAVRSYRKAVARLQENWRRRVGGRKNRSIALKAIDLLPSNPSLSVRSLADLTSSSETRSGAALRRLEEVGILRGRRADAGLRLYDADRIYEMYEVMASTIRHASAADFLYEEVLSDPFGSTAINERSDKATATSGWTRCQKKVKSTGRACGLQRGHAGACRHLAHRKHAPKQNSA